MRQGLRSFLEKIEASCPRQLRRVCEPVQPLYDATALVMTLEQDPDCPILYLERVVGSEFPLVANVLATKGRLALAMGVSEAELMGEYARRYRTYIPPTLFD